MMYVCMSLGCRCNCEREIRNELVNVNEAMGDSRECNCEVS